MKRMNEFEEFDINAIEKHSEAKLKEVMNWCVDWPDKTMEVYAACSEMLRRSEELSGMHFQMYKTVRDERDEAREAIRKARMYLAANLYTRANEVLQGLPDNPLRRV